MKTLILFLFPVLLSAQTTRTEWEKEMQRRQHVFEKYEPGYAVGQAILPGLLGVIGGAMNTDNTRGKIAQQAIFFGAVVSIGSWDKQPAKRRFLNGLCFIAGCALGVAAKQANK